MEKILVTGGAGYIGSHTVDALINANFKVVIVDNLSSGYKELLHPEAKFYEYSILDKEKLLEVLINEKITGVIHFAAKIVVPESIEHPLDYYTNNTYGVISLLDACKKANVTKIVFSSTAAVYGDLHTENVVETDETKPINPYGFSKLFSEQIIRDSEKDFGLKSVIFRYFNVAGANLSSKLGQRSKASSHLIKIASETACRKRPHMFITGTDYSTPDGTGIRDYIHVEDLADAHVLAMNYLLKNGKSETLNCGYGHGHSVREVIDCIKKVSGVDFPVREGPRRPGDTEKLIADSSKLKILLGWSPKKDNLYEICKSAFEYERLLD